MTAERASTWCFGVITFSLTADLSWRIASHARFEAATLVVTAVFAAIWIALLVSRRFSRWSLRVLEDERTARMLRLAFGVYGVGLLSAFAVSVAQHAPDWNRLVACLPVAIVFLPTSVPNVPQPGPGRGGEAVSQ